MIRLTIEVTPDQLRQIVTILEDSPEPVLEPTAVTTEVPKQSVARVFERPTVAPKSSEPVVTKPTPKKGGATGIKLPGFGRTQAQVSAYEELEATRVEALDEEEELKKQRAEERATKKAEKDKEAAEKQEAKDLAAKEVEAIKATPAEPAAAVVSKPWAL